MATQVMEQSAARVFKQMQKRAPHSDANFYLEGPYAPVAGERADTELAVRGEIPEALQGLVAQIGPNPGTHHRFIGDGMVHGVRLGDGRARWYRRR